MRISDWSSGVCSSDLVEYAVVWQPPPGGLKTFPNLKAIVSMGAGVDHVLRDPELPRHLPVIRTVGPDLTQRMREYVLLQVLRFHRRLPEIEDALRGSEERRVGKECVCTCRFRGSPVH